MNIPIERVYTRFELEIQRALWVSREKIAWERLRRSHSDEVRRGALGDLRAARAELKAVRNLLALLDGGAKAPSASPEQAAAAWGRIDATLNPQRTAPVDVSRARRDSARRARQLERACKHQKGPTGKVDPKGSSRKSRQGRRERAAARR